MFAEDIALVLPTLPHGMPKRTRSDVPGRSTNERAFCLIPAGCPRPTIADPRDHPASPSKKCGCASESAPFPPGATLFFGERSAPTRAGTPVPTRSFLR